jgi:hypothetical protein
VGNYCGSRNAKSKENESLITITRMLYRTNPNTVIIMDIGGFVDMDTYYKYILYGP